VERWRRKWCAVNRQFSENWEVVRWRAVGNRQRWSKQSQKRLLLSREFDSGCEFRNLHAELS